MGNVQRLESPLALIASNLIVELGYLKGITSTKELTNKAEEREVYLVDV